MKKIKLISIMLIFSIVISVCAPSIYAIGIDNDNIDLPTNGLQDVKIYEMTEEEARVAKEITSSTDGKVTTPELYAFSTNSYGSTHGYNKLATQAEKSVYTELLAAATYFQGCEENAVLNSESGVYNAMTGDISKYNIHKDDFLKIYLTFLYDNPQIYFVESVGYTYYNSTGNIATVVLNCHSEYAIGSTRTSLNNTIDAMIENYLDIIVQAKTDYEKEFIIHELLIANLEYAYDESGNPESSSFAHTIVGAFDNYHHEVVCEGYAKAFQLLLNACGIECIFVGGIGGGGGHAWNQVKIENQWYNVDVTWDDAGGDYIRYTYLNVTDANFTDHTPFPSSATNNQWCYDVNTCTATANSYTNMGKADISNLVSVTYDSTDKISFYVFNNGVEVPSNSKIKVGTKLDIEIYAYTSDLVNNYDLMLNDTTKISYKLSSTNTDTGVSMYTASCTALDEDMVFSMVPNGLKLNVSSLTYQSKGQTSQLTASYGGSTVDSSKLTFSTDNPYVATVSSTGKITSVGAGTAVITVKYAEKNLEATVNVTGTQSYTLGDVNNDGLVNISDAYCMVKFLTYRIDTTTASVLPAANFETSDSNINISDAYTFIQYLANNI